MGKGLWVRTPRRDIVTLMLRGVLFSTTPTRVERGIRHAVTKSFDNMDPDTMYELFGNTISYHRGKATNAQFIAALSDVIRVAENEE